MKWIKKVLPEITLSAYSCLFIYFNNIGEGKFVEIILPFLVFSSIGVLLHLLFCGVFQSGDKASVYSFLLLIMVINFNFVVDLIRKKQYVVRPLFILIMWLIIYIILFCIIIKIKMEGAWNYVCNVISFVCIGLILFNGIGAVPSIVSLVKSKNIHEFELAEKGNMDKAGRNVYFMIFDEYGGKRNLQHYYDFDNREFEEYLTSKGFSYSSSSYNKEAYSTIKVVPNLLNLNYVSSEDDNENRAYLKEPALYRYFWDMGYQINLVNHQNFLGKNGCNNLLEEQKAIGTDVNFTNYLFEKSIISSILRNIIPENSLREYEQYVNSLTEAIKGMEFSWQAAKGGKTFTLCYLQCPHTYFIHNEDGGLLPEDDIENWENKSIYIGQVKYLNKCIQKTVDAIIENDPEAVIILQSDHGARYPFHCEMIREEKRNIEEKYMENILNCVYWGAEVEAQDIEGLSGVNTLRLVLNIEFGSDFEMISVPVESMRER